MKYLIILFLFFIVSSMEGQNIYDTLKSVQLTAQIIQEPEAIKLVWVNDPGVTNYKIYRKHPSASAWGTSLQTNNFGDTTYLDHQVEKGKLYEYRVVKQTGDSLGYGYLNAGYEYELPRTQKTILLLVEDTTHDVLSQKIDSFAQILTSEGWITHIQPINKDSSVQYVKSIIIDKKNSLLNLTTVLILGNVPLPHSGNMNPDGHTTHKGAWSADIYYGELDGAWTDTEVTNTSSDNPRNHNVPGDGKLDQSFIPDSVDLIIGRVDCSELPVFENMDEYQLLDRYIDKNIAFRTAQYIPRRRAVFKNRNPYKEGLGQNALRNFSTIVSPDSITYYDFFDAFYASFLWSYGGSSGSQISSLALGNIYTYSENNFQATFTAYFGSYYGDYDFENNLLRTILASGKVLTTAWVGAPHWFYHPMAMGLDMGYCTLLSQNNVDTYHAGVFTGSVHVNLLGDPTLRAYYTSPPANLAIENIESNALLSWDESADNILGYHIYRRKEQQDTFTRITGIPIQGITYTDSCLAAADYYTYLVRAVKLEVSPSGSYYNESSGPIIQSEAFMENNPLAAFTWTIEDEILTTTNDSENATNYLWVLPDGSSLTDAIINFNIADLGSFDLTLIASNACFSDTISSTILHSGIDEIDMETIKVFPNPASDYVNIEFEEAVSLMKIMDMNGKMMHEEINMKAGIHQVSIASWAKSMYLIQVTTSSSNKIIELMLE